MNIYFVTGCSSQPMALGELVAFLSSDAQLMSEYQVPCDRLHQTAHCRRACP